MDLLRTLSQLYPLILIGLATALILAARRRSQLNLWLKLGIAAIGILWMSSTPIVSQGLLGSLEHSFELLREWPVGCKTIVVLAGSMNQSDQERIAARLGESSLHRCLETARLYRQFGHPKIVISGGPSPHDPNGPAVADAMKEFLVELGVADQDITAETQSRTTYENSIEATKLLKKNGIEQIVLVTDAAHMSRALKCFKQRGLHVTSASCHFQTSYSGYILTCFVPTSVDLVRTQYALHEYVGMLYYSLLAPFR